MKKVYKIITLLLVSITLSGCSLDVLFNKNKVSKDDEPEVSNIIENSQIQEPEVKGSFSKQIDDWYLETQENKYIVTVMGATYCSHCSDFKPIIEEVSQENNIILRWFYVDELGEVAANKLEESYPLQELGSVPYMFITNNGELIDYHIGSMEKSALLKFLEKNRVI